MKSDTTVPPALQNDLNTAFRKLCTEQETDPDRHPRGTMGVVHNLVNPSMYPLVYGFSRFIAEETVGVAGASEKWTSKGDGIQKESIAPQHHGFPGPSRLKCHSETYQWLPANLEFQQNGEAKFTSYINNLHPDKHPEIYGMIEKLVDITIPAWGHVLHGDTRTTHGVDEESLPDDDPSSNVNFVNCSSPDVNFDNDSRFNEEYLSDEDYFSEYERDEDMHQKKAMESVREGKSNQVRFGRITPAHYEGLAHINLRGCWEPPNLGVLTEREKAFGRVRISKFGYEEAAKDLELHPEKIPADFAFSRLWGKWRILQDPIYPQPTNFRPLIYGCGQSIRDKFRDTGLQVVVKMTNIELTPEKSWVSAEEWHVDGQLNERIVATALYFVDCENVTTGNVSYRMQTDASLYCSIGDDSYCDDIRSDFPENWCEPDEVRYFEQIYGTNLRRGTAIQNFGNVQIPKGRLLVFPSVL